METADKQTSLIAVARAASLAACLFCFSVSLGWCQAPSPSSRPCRVQPTTFDGWNAERMSNAWVTLTFVPQLGGRLMQVELGGHSYLFVNPRYKGQDIPPSVGAPLGRWFNYGGDKIWPMPFGKKDEQHWAGPVSGPLDDGVYRLTVLSQGPRCTVRLDGPPDPQKGLQYAREISIGRDSPEILFHAEMKNIAAYPIQWGMQSVTQYDLSDPQNPALYNHKFWAFTPANPHSAYLGQYHVSGGLSRDPSFSVRDGLFTLHWLYLDSEVWIDSPGGWAAMVDGSSHYAMVERFPYDADAHYPGHATVIFYKNGPSFRLSAGGTPEWTLANTVDTPYYMEAEINSPMVTLKPDAMDTEWFPARMRGELRSVTYAGVVGDPLTAITAPRGVSLEGAFGVFFAGRLMARLYDKGGIEIGVVPIATVSPLHFVSLNQTIPASSSTVRISIHLKDFQGRDRGPLGEAWVKTKKNGL